MREVLILILLAVASQWEVKAQKITALEPKVKVYEAKVDFLGKPYAWAVSVAEQAFAGESIVRLSPDDPSAVSSEARNWVGSFVFTGIDTQNNLHVQYEQTTYLKPVERQAYNANTGSVVMREKEYPDPKVKRRDLVFPLQTNRSGTIKLLALPEMRGSPILELEIKGTESSVEVRYLGDLPPKTTTTRPKYLQDAFDKIDRLLKENPIELPSDSQKQK